MTNFGNSYGVRNTGLRDPNEESAISKLNIASEKITNPDLSLYERGEFLAEVIRYHMNFDQNSDIPFRLHCRPLDTHLGLDSIAQLPIFYPIPSLYNSSVPAPGTIVRVRFDNLNNKNFGTYHGPENGLESPTNISSILKSSAENGTTNKDRIDPKSAFKKNDPVDPKKAQYCSRDSNGDIKTSYQGCASALTEGPRVLNISGVGMVEKNFILYTDGRGKSYLAADYMKSALDAMSQAMKNETGITLKITDLFRPTEQQQCYRDRYLSCVREWEDSGRKGKKPAPAASANEPFSPVSHLAGNAVDIQTGVARKNIDHIVNIARQSGTNQQALALVKEEANRVNIPKHGIGYCLIVKNMDFVGAD